MAMLRAAATTTAATAIRARFTGGPPSRHQARLCGSGGSEARPSPVRVNLTGMLHRSCQSLPNCDGGSLGAVVHSELSHGVLEVGFHGLFGQAELVANLPIGETAGEKRDHPHLLQGQAKRPLRPAA